MVLSPTNVGAIMFGWLFTLCGNTVGAQTTAKSPPVRMLLEIVLDTPTCVLHQNFAFKVRILNPNAFPVQLRGFEMDSYIEPEVHLLLNSGEIVHLRYHASASAWTKQPVLIPAGGLVEKQRFLVNDHVATIQWPVEPGVYDLQLATHLSTALIEGEAERRRIEWERPITELRVVPPGALDQKAWSWLEPQFAAYAESIRNPKQGDEHVSKRKVRIYADFLSRFPQSSYAPAIRWETGKLLIDLLGNGAIEASEVPQMVDLLDKCVTLSLDRGGAYAEGFARWDADRGGSQLVELAFQHNRPALLKRVVQAIDEKNPDDEPARLFRQVVVAGVTKSMSEARQVSESLASRFPESQYAKKVPSLLRQLVRKRDEPQH